MVNTFIFIPYNLGVSSRTYSNQDFHRDIQNYVRLSTPVFELGALLNDPSSPLIKCEQILQTHKWYTSGRNRERLVTNLKMLRPVFNASLRSYLRAVLTQHRRAEKSKESAAELERSLETLVAHAREFMDRFRTVERLQLDHADDAVKHIVTAYRFADEALSLVYEDALLWSYRIADKYLKGDECKNLLSAEVEHEIEYRRLHKYRSILREGSSNEQYLQAASQLKKYTTSALYLSTSTEREGATLEQVLFAIAAGISMVFATFIAFYSQSRYGVMTVPVFVALVVGYMFKDRIKEVGRSLSEKMIRNFRYDLRMNLFTPEGKHKIGHVREKMTFLDPDDLPDEVRRVRGREDDYPSVLEDLDVEVISYAKEVNVSKSVFRELDIGGAQVTGIRDIMRYDIRRYLRKTADPVEERYMLKDGELVTVECHKTYQLEFVTEYRSCEDGEPVRYQHTFVRLDRDGITNVRHVR